MKKSSKSILSPNHNHNHSRDPPCLSSATRRLKTNRSLRGAQSPMPRGPRPFDNPEPSSPKVTCIGQVKIKTRKKHINNSTNRNLQKTLSRNRGDLSFWGVDKNQRWVHFPVTICEALSCLFPCRTPTCFKRDKGCAVFARWLVAEREIIEESKEKEMGFRRHGVGEIEVELKEEEGRVSICVPPKNALLLMRCRSDPLRANALANRLFECRVENDDNDETVFKGNDLIFTREFIVDEKLGYGGDIKPEEREPTLGLEGENFDTSGENFDTSGEILGEEGENLADVGNLIDFSYGSVEKTEGFDIEKTDDLLIGERVDLLIGKIVDLEFRKMEELVTARTEELENELEIGDTESLVIENVRKTEKTEMWKTEELVLEDMILEEPDRRNSRYSCSSVMSLHLDIAERETEEPQLEEEKETEVEQEEEETEVEQEEEKETDELKGKQMLPDCLLLMRCEPKLSMEVSKETWICSTDFIRWLPQSRPKSNKIKVPCEPKKETTIDSDATCQPEEEELEQLVTKSEVRHHQPPRSSCSFPAPPPTSMAAMIEQRLMSAMAYEPYVLTRCKSEPMRTAAAKLVPESCFWKNRKFEPHRSATFGVNAAGVGF